MSYQLYETVNPKAIEARQRLLDGENCAMAVLEAFARDARAPRVNPACGIGLGGGVAGQRHLCGALNAAAQVIGAAVGTQGLEPKAAQVAANKRIRPLLEAFEQRYASPDCGPLLKAKPALTSRKPFCADLVAWTVDAVDAALNEL